jgi:peptidoglycan/LPS O-acetylase OafA/YrhL
MFSLNRSENDTSVALDLLRALAAEMVCVGHAVSFFVPPWRPVRFAYMQNVGVLLFFLISGFLITYTLIVRSQDPGYDFRQFFTERFARIYSGLIPALVIIAAIDAVTIYVTGDPIISRNFNLKTLIANIFMLEGYRGILSNFLQWSAFGSASPLWTLGIEWHIYLFVASLFFMVVKPKSIPILIPIALFFGQTPVHFLFGSYQPDGVGRGLFVLWLCGALVYLAMRSRVIGFFPAVALGVGGTAGFILLAHAGGEYDFKLYPFLIAAFFGLVAATQSTHLLELPKIKRSISFFADFSFSLYLVHHTIMYAIWICSPSRGIGVFAIAVLISNLVAIGLAEIGEKHHRKLARALNHWIFPRASQPLTT